jgi:hypothetical protein
MIQQRHLTLIGRAGLAVAGACAATTVAFAAPAFADEPTDSGNGPTSQCSTAAGEGSGTGAQASEGTESSGGSGGGCVDNGTGPGGPGYNGVDPRG